ncbi:hypothetical protein FNU76_10165 [Chitinimonas arctica]|uniref:DUF2793 domain-containing protein n=1 Tax=Chitinimonas arctica TaxID=2594795 RepID=A0A516SFA0_9NEIS|nr:hypothetical protein [Chitinimonas arctica]QDQ26698.1 hypothetical protein FNU76_10165 [Chitinimonas arctica]
MVTTVTVPVALGGSGLTYTSDDNPLTGFGNGGHEVRFPLALDDTVSMAATAVAAASAAAAGLTASAYSGTSASAVALGVGNKTLTTQAGKSWFVGQFLQLVSGIGNYMQGQVTAYAGTSLTVSVSRSVGSGSASAWIIMPGGSWDSSAATAAALTIDAPTNGAASNTAVPNGMLMLANSAVTTMLVTHGFFSGGGAPYGWVQPRTSNAASFYNYVLCPVGGDVLVGTDTPAASGQARLLSAGGFRVQGGAMPTGAGISLVGNVVSGRLCTTNVYAINSYVDDGKLEIASASSSGQVTGVVMNGGTANINAGTMQFFTKSAEAARITPNGEFLLNTATAQAGYKMVVSGALYVTSPIRPGSYTKATLPAAGSYTGAQIYVTDDSNGSTPAFSDGTAWRRVADRTVVA